MSIIYPYLDFIWLPLGLVIVDKSKRLIWCGFMLSCAFMMRMQVELMEWMGHPRGYTGLLDMHAFDRGLICYSIIYGLYLILMSLSKYSLRLIVMAVSISFLIGALVFSAIIMVL